jgi:hypothetical protein
MKVGNGSLAIREGGRALCGDHGIAFVITCSWDREKKMDRKEAKIKLPESQEAPSGAIGAYHQLLVNSKQSAK